MSAFATTQWSLVLAARGDDDRAARAMAELCRRYRQPVLAYIRRCDWASGEAEDLAQSFFLRLLERRWDQTADPARGRFRNYLLGSLQHFLADRRDALKAAKRGGDVVHLPVEEGLPTQVAAVTPEQAFERDFAGAVIEGAIARLRAEAIVAGRHDQFEALVGLLIEPREAGVLKAMAQAQGVRSNTLAVALKRLRARLTALIREELGQTVADLALIDQEVQVLRAALRAG